MATANTALQVADLDFFSIKENLKGFLKNQDTFSDYDFEGSGLQVLLDLLAYNTAYNGWYLNMVANESFLDTSQMRNNILSHAKAINYVPQSSHAAMAKVNIRVFPSYAEDPSDSIQHIVLDKYTKFYGVDSEGIHRTFVTAHANDAVKVAGVFNFANVVLKQGDVITLQFSATTDNEQRRYEIPSANVDVSTIEVTVQASPTNTWTDVYTQATDLTEIKGTDNVYFVEENENLNYTIYFGDNVIGRAPQNGSIINVTYLDVVGSRANNISKFYPVDPIAKRFTNKIVVTAKSSSYGGTDKEGLDQIRFRAPNFYTTQNRAVTENDYESLILRDYNNIEAVSVWGGETNDPPVYGKVFMSLKTRGYFTLTELEKDVIKNELIANRNVMTIIPEIIDPNYCFIQIRGSVTYNPSLTTKSGNELKSIVKQAILDYNQTELNTFKSTFKKSRLQYYIDICDNSITGSDLHIFLQQRIPLEFKKVRKYNIDFGAPLRKGSLVDKLFTFPEMVVADSDQTLRSVYLEEIPSSFTGVDAVDITDAGFGYEYIPEVVITGDGSNAQAEAVVVNGRVTSINVINPGVNYTRATVSIIGGGGQGAGKGVAKATAVLAARYGTLRAYYYRTNGEKVIVLDKIGTVDYDTGKIVLNNITPLNNVENPFYDREILTISVPPESEIIPPLRNRILTIDALNAQSILIDMVPES
jgi:hypothetical protein